MAADGIIFYVPRESALVNPWTVLGGEYVKTRALAQGATFRCSKTYIFQFSSLKSPKPQFWGTFNAFPTENKNANNF